MNHFMSFTRSELIKFFVTHFTFKRFDIGMNSFMNFQTTKFIAQFSTINTFKRFWIKMSGLMVFEGIWVSKFLSAKIAFQCFFTNMNTFLVYCERFQMFEFFIASLTFIGFLSESYLGKVLAIWGGTNPKIFHLFRWKCKKCHFWKISGEGLSGLSHPPLLPGYVLNVSIHAFSNYQVIWMTFDTSHTDVVFHMKFQICKTFEFEYFKYHNRNIQFFYIFMDCRKMLLQSLFVSQLFLQ